MPDYTNASSKPKETGEPKTPPPEKNIQPVVTGEVIIRKKGLFKKTKEAWALADFGSAVHFVIYDIIIPNLKNVIVDSVAQGTNRVLWREEAGRRRYFNTPHGSQYTSYNAVSSRGGYRELPPAGPPGQRRAPAPTSGPRGATVTGDVFFVQREDAERVLFQMHELISTYGVASVSDLMELCNRDWNFVDTKWGWVFLGDARIAQLREGYLLDLPQPEPINVD